jgi:hypothetical protein
MEQFRNWYVRNQDAITWFIIGFLTMQGLNELAKGDYVWAGISFMIAYANYAIRNFRMQ